MAALNELQNFTLKKLNEKLASEDGDFDEWLEQSGLLHARRTCPRCHGETSIKVICDRRYGNWRCKTKNCRKETGYFVGTFFEGSKLSTKQIFELMYLWARKYGTIDDVQQETGHSRRIVIDWFNFGRDICAEFFVRHPIAIGGPGCVVEIDETLVVKRKYGVGRVLKKQDVWLFGGVERDSNWERVFMVPVESRSANRLIPLIQQYILPGTTIVSDEWRSYRGIPNLPQNYTHLTVNHSQNFINPGNRLAHTQNVESMWKKLKRNFKQQFGNKTETYDTYFPEFVWRQRFGDNKNVFYHFWLHVSQFYPCE